MLSFIFFFLNVKKDPKSYSHNLLLWVVFGYFDKCIVAERNKRSCLPSIQYSSSGLTTLTSPVPDLVRISVSCLVFLIRWEHGVQNTYLLLKKSKKKLFSYRARVPDKDGSPFIFCLHRKGFIKHATFIVNRAMTDVTSDTTSKIHHHT